mgnify:CR=1 FL=1
MRVATGSVAPIRAVGMRITMNVMLKFAAVFAVRVDSHASPARSPGEMTPPRNTASAVMQSNVVAVPKSTMMHA